MWTVMLALGGIWLTAQEDKPRLVIATPDFPGTMPELSWRVVRVRMDKDKSIEEVIGEWVLFDQAIELPNEGPFDVYVVPKGGLPVRLAEKVKVPRGQTVTLRLDERLGVVRIFGEGLPQPRRLVLTRPRDPGPGAKGHVPVQQAERYRQNMLVPAGTYELWLVPLNGARPQRIAENIRVLAGRSVGVDD